MWVNKFTIFLVAAIFFLAAAYNPASAREITVGDNGSCANFKSIQEAVNNSSSGDLILVYPGTYNESVNIGIQNISVFSKFGNPEDTIVRAFAMHSNNVTLSGFGIQGNLSINGYYSKISDNIIFDGDVSSVSPGPGGIILLNNTLLKGHIELIGCPGNKIHSNYISNAKDPGISLSESSFNQIDNNTVVNCSEGIFISWLSSDNTINNNILTSNYRGILIGGQGGNSISNNTISNNDVGIWFCSDSSGNLVTNNKVEQNKIYGVYLNQVTEVPYNRTNRLYNNIFNNTINLYNHTSNYYTKKAISRDAGIILVVCNTTKTAGTSIVGKSYIGGNYWAKPDGTGFSQTCNDWDGDGIGDSIYTISVNIIDYLPLVFGSKQEQTVFPAVDFSANVTSGYVPLSVLFTDFSQNVTAREWDFNNDGICDSTDATNVFVYTAPGTYIVNLTVSNENGTVSRLSAVTASTKPQYTLVETQITTNKSKEMQPAIYGDRIVWLDDRNGMYDLYMYDLSTQKEINITANQSAKKQPAIHGDKIVWEDWRNVSGYSNYDIYMYDLSTQKETQITDNKSVQNEPAIYGDKIVWADGRNGNYDIYMYNLSTSKETRITTNESQQEAPEIYGDRIVWQDSRNRNSLNENSDIYMYNTSTSTETQITVDDSFQYNPVIYGDKIVWQDSRNGASDIYVYDISISKETQLTNAGSWVSGLAIYGDRIVWNDNRDGNYDIYMYNLSTFKETQITTHARDDYSPAIYEDRIVWEGVRKEDNRNEYIVNYYPYTITDIYMCTLSEVRQEQKSPVADFSASPTSGYAPLKVLFTDNSTGSPTSWLWDFGDDIHSKHAMNATHTFTRSGKYNVSLTVANADGIDTETKSEYIIVSTDEKQVN
ncbi:NosD domain-containing protein [Methanosarcina sp.]|uniref:NosD domain-containing protein n=1 Tax=Methanosarcina sp. TaxID=2213 RepID=UPI002ABB5A57|nr:NosD domain-containing protein [Methanosarcina sp.]MDY9926706.1 NosD domain-containing protein [Methanosarcina sp.]